ncbi:hypothetical protein GZ77_26775 [Endozoicomonas montiporae]|uniref:Uncharacterized protein n=1 Tax=Endozoicomonas montiporae TaxID=1027273 RepID=A0A081MYC1_9GAMM|nr:hypothetical protein [Endozoicomonas montiporae]KEQ11194.1 hypothetical protein GZ77_26775 [Endozoicomonas montiporae]
MIMAACPIDEIPAIPDPVGFNPYISTGRNIKEGNRCGSNLYEKHAKPRHQKKFTVLINTARKNNMEYLWARGAMYHESPFDYTRKSNRKKKDGIDRQERLEGRQRHVIVRDAMLRHVNLYTYTLGYFCNETGRYIAYTLQELWKRILDSLPPSMDFSFDRFKTEWRQMKRDGYVRVEKRTYTVTIIENGEEKEVVRNDVPIKYLTPKFFHNLGITKKNMKQAKVDSLKSIQKTISGALKGQGPISVDDLKAKTDQLIRDWKKSKGVVRLWLEEKARNIKAAKQARKELNQILKS